MFMFVVQTFQGYTTMTMNCSQELHNIGCAWHGLKEQLGEEIDDVIRGMTFLKGKMVGLSFNVPQVGRGQVTSLFSPLK
jgi:hypothetical protein